jgi:glycerophosphoryl diester phosphodiesterase
VAHDTALNPSIARGADGRWLEAKGPAIHALTHAELSRYDVGRLKPGSAYARGFPDQVAVDGTRIPRLADVFALAREAGDTRVRFNIETKLSPLAPDETLPPEPFARALIAEIRGAGLSRRATIQSFDWRTLQVVRREAPEIATVYLTARQRFLDNVCSGVGAGTPVAAADCAPSPWTAGFQLREHGSVPRMVRAAGGDAWTPFYRDLDAAAVKEAHDLGLRVVAWTVNDVDEARRLREMGVDGLITDRPDLVR